MVADHLAAGNRALGVDWPTIRWYDPITRDGIPTGKRRTILDALKQDRPIVWLDDEETTYNAGLAIQTTPHDVVDIRPACGKPDTIGNHG